MPTPQWNLAPDAGNWTITHLGPETLVTTFEDQGQSIREKSSRQLRAFAGRFTLTPAQVQIAEDIFALRRYIYPVTIHTYDPASNDPDNELALVLFVMPRAAWSYAGTVLARGVWRFREV